jgi:hypothetical protein
MIRALLAAILLLNAGAPSAAAADTAPVDAGQSQHAGHDMPMDGDPSGHPATDCCNDGSMDCPCGCLVPQPGAPHFVTTIRTRDVAAEPAVVVILRHPAEPVTSPFRPPA